MNQSKVFVSAPCLTERSSTFTSQDLAKKWFKNCDKRYLDRTVQDFLQINQELLKFLGVTPILEGTGNDLRLNFKTDKFVGAIPLRSPVNGLVFADFIIYPRFMHYAQENTNDYVGLVNLLKEDITPEFVNSPNLTTKDQIKPPLYYDCIKYINSLLEVTRINWVKFNNRQENFPYPKGQIIWREYFKNEWNPKNRIIYPCQINFLEKHHSGLQEFFYVFLLAKEIISNQSTPAKLRYSIQSKIELLDNFFQMMVPKKCSNMKISNSDPVIVKKAKSLANIVLRSNSTETKAWRVDFSIIFERYIQFLFEKVSNKAGWKRFNNIKYLRSARNYPVWSLSYFEPDLVLRKDESLITIDAKYKSHFFNMDSLSESLREDHRSDIHQIAAYCGFHRSDTKIGFLCYPSNHFESRKLFYKDFFSYSGIKIYLFGIPITFQNIKVIEKELEGLFYEIIHNDSL